MWEQYEDLIADIASRYVDDEDGVELDDLLQEGRLAAWLLTERGLSVVRPWHLKLVMSGWASHIRNKEVAADTEGVVTAIARAELGDPAESPRSRAMRHEHQLVFTD